MFTVSFQKAKEKMAMEIIKYNLRKKNQTTNKFQY